MSKSLTCDRCLTTVMHELKSSLPENWQHLKTEKPSYHYDLCGECIISFNAFIDNSLDANKDN